jgi:hypothetical protein
MGPLTSAAAWRCNQQLFASMCNMCVLTRTGQTRAAALLDCVGQYGAPIAAVIPQSSAVSSPTAPHTDHSPCQHAANRAAGLSGTAQFELENIEQSQCGSKIRQLRLCALASRGCRHGLSLAFGAVLQCSRRARWCVQPASVCQDVATCAQLAWLAWLAVQWVTKRQCNDACMAKKATQGRLFVRLPVTALALTTPCHPSHSSRCPRTDATRVASESGHAMCNAASQLLAGACEVIPCKPSPSNLCVLSSERTTPTTHARTPLTIPCPARMRTTTAQLMVHLTDLS